jgi:predicted amidohydrolase YtcJ
VIELGGRWLLPGFWDEHVHFALWAAHSRRLDLSAANSAAQAADLLRAGLGGGSSDEPLVAVGFRDASWVDAPHRDLLDALPTDRQIFAISADLHAVWLNGAALRRIGHPDHPTGVLREAECFAVETALAEESAAQGASWIAAAARQAAAKGTIGIVDLTMDWTRDDWLAQRAGGLDVLRVECGVYPAQLDQAIAAGGRTGEAIAGDELLRVGPFKVVADGSLNTRTAWCFDPYPGMEGPGRFGVESVGFDELVHLMRRAAAAGLTPAIHAIGDRCAAVVLDAFAAVGCGGRVEHAQLMRWADMDRMAELGLVASIQPVHALDDRAVADRMWPGRTERSFPMAALAQRGIRLALGSDAPVAPLDPWATVAAAVARCRDGEEPWHGEQAISAGQAIAASARGHGSVTVGMVADLQAVERDPFAADAESLRTMPVAATFLAGRPVGAGLG